MRIAESPVRRGRAAATDAANIEVPAPQAITPPPASDRLLLRIPEAAEVLGISRSTMYKLIAAGDVPTVRIGERAVRVSRAALEAFVDRQEGRHR